MSGGGSGWRDVFAETRYADRCEALTRPQRIALAAACAGYVLHFYRERASEQAWLLERALASCWEAVAGATLDEASERLNALNEVVPEYDTETLGAGLPAGESVIAAFMTACMGDEVEQAIEKAYEAVEIHEWGRLSQDQIVGRPGAGVVALSGRDAVQRSEPVQGFLSFLEGMLSALEQGVDPLLLKR